MIDINKLTKKEQLRIAFKNLIQAHFEKKVVVESLDYLVELFLKEVSIRTPLK